MTKFKKTLQAIFVFALGIMFVLTAYKLYFKDGSVNLSKTYQITGQVTSAYETTKRTGGRYASDAPIFAFTINNYNQTLGAYRPNNNYDFLMKSISLGDTIKVYFKERSNDEINIDVYQIEKNGNVILDYQSYQKNHRNLSFFIFPIGLIFILISYKIFKQKKQNTAHNKQFGKRAE